MIYLFFFHDTATTEIYPLSLHDALPISRRAAPTAHVPGSRRGRASAAGNPGRPAGAPRPSAPPRSGDRKSTRLNSSHVEISYAVFCLKKKKKQKSPQYNTHTLTPLRQQT